MAEQVQMLSHYQSDPAVTRQEFADHRVLQETYDQGKLYFLGAHREQYPGQCEHYHSIHPHPFEALSLDRVLIDCYYIVSVLVHEP